MAGSIQGGDVVLRNITTFGGRFLGHLNIVMKSIEEKLREAIKKNISLTDHTLEDLAEMGHPYASAHPANPHEPGYQVHSQSGTMLGGLVSGTSDAAFTGSGVTAEAHAGIEASINYAIFVIFGTSRMIPRDFLTGSLEEVRDQVFSLLQSNLRDAVINFNGEKVRL